MTLTPRERATLAAICRAIVPATDLPLVDLIDDGLTDTPEHLRARFRLLLRILGSPAVARTQPPRPLAIRRLMRRLRHTAALIVLVRDRGSGTVRVADTRRGQAKCSRCTRGGSTWTAGSRMPRAASRTHRTAFRIL